MTDFSNQQILVIGLGSSGVSAANLLVSQGARVTITDFKKQGELEKEIENLKKGIKLNLGKHAAKDLKGKKMIVVSPGVSKDIALLNLAKRKQIKIIGEIELAYNLTSVPLIAVTGTNGKSTTATLISRMLTAGKKKNALGGNIGLPLSELVLLKDRDYLIVEISSFQLEYIDKFQPHISIILNISPDHLDRHQNMREYIKLKKRIYRNQDKDNFLLLNYDDPLTRGLGGNSRARRIFFSRNKEFKEGAFVCQDRIVIRWQGKEEIISTGAGDKFGENWENKLAASLTAVICGVKAPKIFQALSKFEGLEHRLEFVAKIGGVVFINDSKATNTAATLKALQECKKPIILIAGGADKGEDFNLLGRAIEEKVTCLILIGDTKDKIKRELVNFKQIIEAGTLDKAAAIAFQRAKAGDTVLFSPACASFDQFKHYAERGEKFKELIRLLGKLA